MPRRRKPQQRKRNPRERKRQPRRRRRNNTRPGGTPFRDVGRTLGGVFGPVGSVLGGLAGSAVGTIFGSGSYTESLPPDVNMGKGDVRSNVLINPVASSAIPFMHANTEGAIRCSKREFVKDITMSAAGLLDTFIIEPKTFPWLSQVAGAWEKYTMLGCVIEYIPTSGYAVTGDPSLGSVSACFVADNDQITQPVPTSKVQILAFENSVSGSPAAPWALPVECAEDQTQIPVKFVGSSFLAAGTNIKQQTQLGNVIVLATGGPGIYTCGEVWVTYDILLMSPRFQSAALSLIDPCTEEIREYVKLIHDYESLREIGTPCFSGEAVPTIEYYGQLACYEATLIEPRFIRARMMVMEQFAKREHALEIEKDSLRTQLELPELVREQTGRAKSPTRRP